MTENFSVLRITKPAYLYGSVFILLLALGLFLRIENLDHPLGMPEVYRDYLVARNLITHGELPLAGPPNGALGDVGVLNSPVYYYLLATILAVKDDVVFLDLVNILLQVLTVVIIYLIGGLKLLTQRAC